MKTEVLVIVDPQNDFCDPNGSLYVQGAADDIARLARYIRGGRLSGVFVSLDSHDRAAIFHPAFWVNDKGERPAPYTPITPADFKAGKWEPASPANRPFAERTFGVLVRRGVDSLMVWPEHCVVSTWGHQIAAPLLEALEDWRAKTGLAARYVFKGENPYTDQFSIFEGLDDSYPETAFNESLFQRLAEFDRVTFAGEALTHCVAESILSYTRRLAVCEAKAPREVRLLTDCTSPVSGFDGNASLERLREAGVTLLPAS